MSKRLFSILGLIVVGLVGAGWFVPPSTPLEAQGLGIGGYQLVSEVRVTRTQYDYTYRAVLTNPGAAIGGATARVTSQSPATTTVREDELTFGAVAAGGTALSQDTFVIRHDRTVPLNLGVLAWTITPIAANQPPVASIAEPGPIFVNQLAALDGRGSSDPENAALTYQWSFTTRPPGSSAAIVDAAAAQTTFLPDRAGTYVVRLRVNDGSLNGDAELTLTTSNSAPHANAGPDQTVAVQSVVTLDGSGSSDADGQQLAYQWAFLERPANSTAILSDTAAVRPTFVVDRPGTFRIRLVVHDGLVSSTEDHVVVGTTNSAPVANAGADLTVTRGATVTLDAGGSSDVDGHTLTYLWEITSHPAGSTATISDPAALQPTFVADRRGDFVVRLIVGDGFASSEDTVTITTENTRPVANAGADRTVTLAAAVTLDGSASTDVDGDTLTYQWSLASRPPGSEAALTGEATVSPSLVVDVHGEYVVQLIVNDGLIASLADTVTITTENSRPVAEAGPNQTVVAGAAVLLDGTGSRDADGESLRYAWSLTTVPAGSTAALNDATLATPAFIADLPGTYIAQLIVDDSRLTSAPDTVTITTLNTAPTANAGPDQVDVAPGAPVQLDGSASSDPDGHALIWRWSLISMPSGSVAALWDPAVMRPSFTPDLPGTYVAQLIVNDRFVDSAPDTVVLQTRAANRPPSANAGPDVEVVAGATATLDGTGSSDPDGQTVTLQWRLTSAPPGSTAALSGDTSSRPTLTPDLVGQYTVELVVSDGTLISMADTTIVTAIEGAPPPPTITAFDPSSGRAGTAVMVSGANFTAIQQVAFNGLSASFTVVNGTMLSAIVPAAATTGPISVTTAGGTATSAGHFVVTPTQDFQLTVEPATVVVAASGRGPYQVTLTGTSGFANLATLSVGGVPGGADAAFTAATLTADQSTQLSIQTKGVTTAGSVPVTVTATALVNGVQTTRTATVTLQVLSEGVTSVAGQLVTVDDTPIANALIALDMVETRTDAAGNFLLSNVPAGEQRLKINAHVAVPGYPIYHVDLTIVAGQPLALAPFRITPPPPPQSFTPINNSTQAQVISDPRFPGFELTLPQGVTITGWDGTQKTRIAIKRLTPDQLPVPPPPGPTRSLYQIYFGTPMGGIPTARLPVSLPNDQGLDPGQQGEIWWYDAAPVGGPGAWRMAGLGTVSADGTKVVSNPGVGIDRFCGVCGLVCFVDRSDPQPKRNDASPTGADPVDLALGQLIVEKTDLAVPGRIPAVIHRTYNPFDPFGNIRGFHLGLGAGWALSVDVILLEVTPSLRRMILPGNSRIDFVIQQDGSFATTTDMQFGGASMTTTGGGAHRLRLKDGTVWRFAGSFVDGVDMLVEQSDRNGNRLTIERDSVGLVTRIIEPSGRALTMSYTNGRIAQVVDPIGRTVRYEYTGDRLDAVIDATGGTTRYTYDSAGRILTITDPKDIVFVRNEYSPLSGRILKQFEADGSVWLFKYAVLPRATSSAPGTLNPAVVEESAATIAAGLTGDLNSPPISTTVVDPRGHSTTHVLDGGLAKARKDALGQTTRMERDSAGRVTHSKDALGRVTQVEYDARGNATRVIDAVGGVTRFEYEATFNQVTKATDHLGNVMTFEYDAKGNLTAVTDPEENAKPESERRSRRYAYDSVGQRISSTDPLGNATTFTYDARGNLASATDPLGNVQSLTYDLASRVIGQVDPRGRTTRLAYNARDQVTQLTDAIGGTTGFAYDPNGNLVSVTDAKGNAVTYEYNDRDRLVSRTDPNGRSETFTYDAKGNVATAVDRKGQTTRFTYDSRDRRIKSEFADGVVEFTFDAAGRLARLTDTADPHGPIAFEYDLLDRPVSETTALGSVSYVYDGAGRRSRMLASGSQPVLYGYDRNSRLRTITQAPLNPATIDYDAANRRTALTLPNGVRTEYLYDTASRLIELTYRNQAGALGNLTYAYDASGNRTRAGGSMMQAKLPDALTASDYDDANQQVQFGERQSTFDANGNLDTSTGSAGAIQFVWDARNRLVGMSGPGVAASFAYDGLGRRALREVNGRRSQYVYDGLDFISVLEDGTPRVHLRTGMIDEALVRGGSEHLIADALGSTVALLDANGAIATRYAYDAFGGVDVSGAASDNSIQFTGRENDATGLYFYRSRYYSPSARRFTGEDSVEFAGGDVNLYAYVGGNPVVFKDPTGEFIPLLIGAGVGAFTGAIAGRRSGGWKGALLGGAVGAGLGLAGPIIGGTASGFVGSLAGQAVDNHNRGQDIWDDCNYDGGEAIGSAIGGFVGGSWAGAAEKYLITVPAKLGAKKRTSVYGWILGGLGDFDATEGFGRLGEYIGYPDSLWPDCKEPKSEGRQ